MMYNVCLCFLALFAFTAAYPRPADVLTKDDSSETDTEFVGVPLQRSPYPTLNFGFLQPSYAVSHRRGNPFLRASPWDDVEPKDILQATYITEMQEILNEMRRQITLLQNHAKEHGIEDGLGTRIGDDDIPKNKSTSETKVIDGHVVTVNETTYSNGNDGFGAVFRIKVVEVHPSESPEEGGEAEVMPEETSSEVPDNNKSEIEEDKHEETNEIPNPLQKVRYTWSPEFDPTLNEIEEPESISLEKYEPVKREEFYDLSGDTRVNKLLHDRYVSQGLVMIDPDAEVLYK